MVKKYLQPNQTLTEYTNLMMVHFIPWIKKIHMIIIMDLNAHQHGKDLLKDVKDGYKDHKKLKKSQKLIQTVA